LTEWAQVYSLKPLTRSYLLMAQIVQFVIQKPPCFFTLLQALNDFLYLLPVFLMVLFSCSPP
jgi:hypothetical protein